jgi:hypothetical protein
MNKFLEYCNKNPTDEGQMEKVKKLNKEAEDRLKQTKKIAEKNKKLMLKADKMLNKLNKIETFIKNKGL